MSYAMINIFINSVFRVFMIYKYDSILHLLTVGIEQFPSPLEGEGQGEGE